MVPLTSIFTMSPIPTSATQKLIDLVDKFGRDNQSKNEVKKTFALTKKSTKVDYPSFNHVSHAVSNFVNNFVKNVSNYLTPDVKRAFDQLCQAFTKAPILQYFNPE